jgi:hypothetical protein
MKPLVIPFVILAGGAWLSAVVHGIASLGHLNGRISVGAMLFRGIEWFNADNFTPRGQVLQRRFVWSALGFLVAVVLVAIVGALAST